MGMQHIRKNTRKYGAMPEGNTMKSYEEAITKLRPEEVDLLTLMQEYKQVSNQLKDYCKDLDFDINKLMKERSEREKPFREKLADLETKMRLPMMDRKESFICSFGKINFRKGSVLRKWNLDALDQVCAADEVIKKIIWPFRTETVGEPSISIKLEDTVIKNES